jgi:hypothetical protein
MNTKTDLSFDFLKKQGVLLKGKLRNLIAPTLEEKPISVCIIKTIRLGIQKKYTRHQYAHIMSLVDRLHDFDSKSWPVDLDIDGPNEHHLFTLKDSHGPLVDREIQLVFGYMPKHKEIIVLTGYDTCKQLPEYHFAAIYAHFYDYYLYGRDNSWALPIRRNLK